MKKQEKNAGKTAGGSNGATKPALPASRSRPASSTEQQRRPSSRSPNRNAANQNSPKGSPTHSVGMGMKHSKSDHSGLSKKDKHKDKEPKDGKSPMGKKFISKSQENLSSQRKGRQQLTPVIESPKPRSNAASIARAQAAERNKENLALKEKEKNNTGFAKPKPAGPPSKSAPGNMANMRKASSTQSIDKTSHSTVNFKSNTSAKSNTNIAIKRAQSTQNICKDKSLKKRTSAPADVMAYNAELLANFEKEKKLLEVRISELTKVAESRKGEIEKLKYKVKRLEDDLDVGSKKEEMELIRNQNKQLNDRLKELGFPAEQITDAEKLLLKHQLGANTATGVAKSHESNSDVCLQTSVSCDSLSTDGGGAKGGTHNINNKMAGGDLDLRRSNSLSASEPGFSLPDFCGTPDHPSVLSLDTGNWEKQSNKSANSDGALSEASVACLTERILQMEETNYSTTEELQATLQELGDLQDAVNELTEENSRLADERTVLLESLCTQTEKLENTRIQLEQLKCLLISGDLPDKSERDGHLLGLLKSAQEEREELMRKQTEWSNALEALESECKEAQEAGEILRDKYSLLEDSNTALRAEKDAAEKQLSEMKEVQDAEHIEVKRLKTLLENEKTKVAELETARKAQDKTDLEALLDSALRDKDRAEQKVADLSESLALNQCETTRLKDALSSKEQELIVARNNAKSQLDELQFRSQSAEQEKLEATRERDELRKQVEVLEGDCDRHVEDQKSFTSKIQEMQNELRAIKQQKAITESELQELMNKHDVESKDWKQFQKDLQTAVVIANNFSQETQESMEKLTSENLALQEQIHGQEEEINKLKDQIRLMRHPLDDSPSRKPSILTNAELKGKVLTTMDRELTALREGRPHLDQRSQTISVKSLIRSIEEQVKSGCSSIHSSRSESRRSSTSSDISIKDLVKSPTSPVPTPDAPHSPTKDFALRSSNLRVKASDRSPQPNMTLGVGSVPSPGDRTPKSSMIGGRGEGCDVGSAGKVPISSILKDRNTPRRTSTVNEVDTKKETPGKDPLASLAKLMKGSKRNALLKWCQLKTIPYSNVDITNFSSSWNDGLGFCALLHNYVPDKIPYSELHSDDKRKNFNLAFNAGESVGIKSNLNINDMVSMERPDWQAVMNYVTSIYKHFEVDTKSV